MKLPSIFQQTVYRLPTAAELEEIHSYGLPSERILAGFVYTIVGRGVQSEENIKKIVASLVLLNEKYPGVGEYEKALARAKTLTSYVPRVANVATEKTIRYKGILYAEKGDADIASDDINVTTDHTDFKAGGKGPFTLPPDHVAATIVPKGGSNCKNCKYVDAKAHKCNNRHYITWNGGDAKLPGKSLDQICSDWWEGK